MGNEKDNLGRQWLELLKPFSVPPSRAEEIFDCLVNAYSEPGRFYHNLSHIEDVLATIVQLTGQSSQPDLQLAAWFHDAVYDTHAKDNEEKSAVLAGDLLQEMRIPSPIVANVQRLILLTKHHVVDKEDEEGEILIDADLAILGESQDRYEEYAKAIRQEYAWVAEADYRAGRSKILTDFLKRARIYHTKAMFAACEQTARKNLSAEIEELTSP